MTDTKPDFDYVVPLRREGDGTVIAERYRPEGTNEVSIRQSKDGQPIPPGWAMARSKPRKELPGAYDIDVLYEVPRSGPPKVTTDAYRGGWDLIWGKGGDA